VFHPGKILANAAANALTAAASARKCEPPLPGTHAEYIPNVIVQTHHNETARFYDDLIRPRIVLINCMSIRDEANCSHIETMAQVQRLLGKELGRSVFIYSITTDPERDTPLALRGFAEKYCASNGWLFLTGETADIKLLRARLFSHDGGQDCSMHLIRYGNEAVGVWGGVSARASAESIAQRLSWITPRERPTGGPRRSGPLPLFSEG
jgi:protein SCO1/2